MKFAKSKHAIPDGYADAAGLPGENRRRAARPGEVLCGRQRRLHVDGRRVVHRPQRGPGRPVQHGQRAVIARGGGPSRAAGESPGGTLSAITLNGSGRCGSVWPIPRRRACRPLARGQVEASERGAGRSGGEHADRATTRRTRPISGFLWSTDGSVSRTWRAPWSDCHRLFARTPWS